MDPMNECNENDIYTGDLLLYQSNEPSSIMQRLFTKSMWNHVGIAVRLKDPNDYTSIISGNEGFLCTMDFINIITPDVITRTMTDGFIIVPLGVMRIRYSRIAVRPILEKYRDYYIVSKILHHVEKFKQDKFVTNPLTILGPVLGTSLKTERYSSFCSENVGYFLTSMGEDIHIKNLGLLAPRDFIPDILFLNKYQHHLLIYQEVDNTLSSIISPIIIITLFFLIIVTYLLPRHIKKK